MKLQKSRNSSSCRRKGVGGVHFTLQGSSLLLLYLFLCRCFIISAPATPPCANIRTCNQSSFAPAVTWGTVAEKETKAETETEKHSV